jgi:hypothetical protein
MEDARNCSVLYFTPVPVSLILLGEKGGGRREEIGRRGNKRKWGEEGKSIESEFVNVKEPRNRF